VLCTLHGVFLKLLWICVQTLQTLLGVKNVNALYKMTEWNMIVFSTFRKNWINKPSKAIGWRIYERNWFYRKIPKPLFCHSKSQLKLHFQKTSFRWTFWTERTDEPKRKLLLKIFARAQQKTHFLSDVTLYLNQYFNLKQPWMKKAVKKHHKLFKWFGLSLLFNFMLFIYLFEESRTVSW